MHRGADSALRAKQPMTISPRRALMWSFAERYAGLLISVISVMVLSRILTPSQVGIYSLCAAVTAVAGILRDFGISEYLIQEKDLTRDKIRSAYGLAFMVAWSIAALVFFGRNAAAEYYAEPLVAQVLAVLALNFIVLPISSPTYALLNREMAFRQIFQLQLVCSLFHALTSVTLALMGFGALSLAWAPVASATMQAAMLIWLRPKDCLVLPGIREARTVLRFGLMYVASRAIEVLTRNFHDPVIAKQFDFASVGLFSRGFGLIEMFHTAVGSAVVRVATPAFAAQHRAGVGLAEPYARATAIFVSVSWPFFGFIALMSEPIIRLMFGAQWISAAPIATALALSFMPHGLVVLAPQLLSATGQVARRLKVTLVYSPFHIVGVLIASQISLVAVASVWFFSNLVSLTLYLRQLRQVLGVGVRTLMAQCVSSAVIAISSIAAQAGTYWTLRELNSPELLTVPLVFACGAGAWLVTARRKGHAAYKEIENAHAAWRQRRRADIARKV